MLVGCILFAHVYIIGSLWFLIFSQIVLGVGSATLGVTRAYVAEITATRQRTMYMALLTAVQYGAFSGTWIVVVSIGMLHVRSVPYLTLLHRLLALSLQ
jgi:MFS family permease